MNAVRANTAFATSLHCRKKSAKTAPAKRFFVIRHLSAALRPNVVFVRRKTTTCMYSRILYRRQCFLMTAAAAIRWRKTSAIGPLLRMSVWFASTT